MPARTRVVGALVLCTAMVATVSLAQNNTPSLQKVAGRAAAPNGPAPARAAKTMGLGSLHDHDYGFEDIWFADSRTGWALDFGGYVLHTTDAGRTWELQQNLYAGLRAGTSVGRTLGWIVGGGYLFGQTPVDVLFATGDGGTSWNSNSAATTDSLQYPLEDVCFVDGLHGWAVGQAGRIVSTADGGRTWQVRRSAGPGLAGVSFVSATDGWVVGAGGVILHSVDAGQTWIAQTSGTTSDLHAVEFLDGTHGWAVGSGGTVLSTDDAGSGWRSRPVTVPDHAGYTCLDFVTPVEGWVGSDSGAVSHTTDGGSTWAASVTGAGSLIGLAFPDRTTGWGVASDGILASSDGGRSWSFQFLYLWGPVVNAEGELLGQAKVAIGASDSVWTDGNGFWRYWCAPGTYMVTASKDGYTSRAQVEVANVDRPAGIGLRLDDPLRELSGILSGLGPDAGSAWVTALRASTGASEGPIPVGSDGRWHRHVPEGTYWLIPFCSGYRFTPPSLPVGASGDVSGLSFAAEKAFTVTGTVETHGGSPISGATVRIQGNAFADSTVSASDGSWGFYAAVPAAATPSRLGAAPLSWGLPQSRSTVMSMVLWSRTRRHPSLMSPSRPCRQPTPCTRTGPTRSTPLPPSSTTCRRQRTSGSRSGP